MSYPRVRRILYPSNNYPHRLGTFVDILTSYVMGYDELVVCVLGYGWCTCAIPHITSGIRYAFTVQRSDSSCSAQFTRYKPAYVRTSYNIPTIIYSLLTYTESRISFVSFVDIIFSGTTS